jgi:hypothetical protein
MAMRRWMLLSKKTGQLGNRLTVYAHCLAAARERGYRFLNPAFCEYAPFFVGPRAHVAAADELPAADAREPSARARTLGYLLARAAYKSAKVVKHVSFGAIAVARARNEEHLDLRAVVEAAELRGCRYLVLQGYHFRHNPWFAAHDGFIREFLAAAAPWATEGRDAVAALRRECDTVVGVHIRHGDYREHLGGRFFWPVPQYAAFMARMVALLAPARVGFMVCSNAVHGREDFHGFTWRAGPGHLVSDQQALAGCDWILGPPSSFSSWAAYVGRSRLLRLEDPLLPFHLEDFQSLATPDPLY